MPEKKTTMEVNRTLLVKCTCQPGNVPTRADGYDLMVLTDWVSEKLLIMRAFEKRMLQESLLSYALTLVSHFDRQLSIPDITDGIQVLFGTMGYKVLDVMVSRKCNES